LEFVAAESLEGIAKTEQSITLNLCQNDLDVFQFILTFTRCADATSLLQSNVDETRICAIKGGGHSMCFRKHKAQAPSASSEILAEVEGHKMPNFMQLTNSGTVAELLNWERPRTRRGAVEALMAVACDETKKNGRFKLGGTVNLK